MKIILAGSRNISSMARLEKAIANSPFAKKITEVVSGGAKGVDQLGEEWARKNNVVVKQFLPEWDNIKRKGAVVGYNKFGKPFNRAAGPERNRLMAKYANGAIILWNGVSKGSESMILEAHRAGIPVYVEIVKEKK